MAFMFWSSVDKSQLMFSRNLCSTNNTQDTSFLTVPVYACTHVYGGYGVYVCGVCVCGVCGVCECVMCVNACVPSKYF